MGEHVNYTVTTIIEGGCQAPLKYSMGKHVSYTVTTIIEGGGQGASESIAWVNTSATQPPGGWP